MRVFFFCPSASGQKSTAVPAVYWSVGTVGSPLLFVPLQFFTFNFFNHLLPSLSYFSVTVPCSPLASPFVCLLSFFIPSYFLWECIDGVSEMVWFPSLRHRDKTDSGQTIKWRAISCCLSHTWPLLASPHGPCSCTERDSGLKSLSVRGHIGRLWGAVRPCAI